jgi:hypothetical protein
LESFEDAGDERRLFRLRPIFGELAPRPDVVAEILARNLFDRSHGTMLHGGVLIVERVAQGRHGRRYLGSS